MADPVKRPNLIWFIAIGVLVLAIGVAIYMVWRRVSTTDLTADATKRATTDIRLELEKLRAEVARRDDRIEDLQKQITRMNERFLVMRTGTARPARAGKKKDCADGSCSIDAGGVEDMDSN